MKQTDNIFIDQGKSFDLTISTDTQGKTFSGYIRKHINDTNIVSFQTAIVSLDSVKFSLSTEQTSSLLNNLTMKTWVYEIIEIVGNQQKTIRSGNAIIEPGISA